MPSSFFGWIGFLLKEYGPLFVEGTINTIIIAVVGTLIGFFFSSKATKVRKATAAIFLSAVIISSEMTLQNISIDFSPV